jgi:kinesin family protein 11
MEANLKNKVNELFILTTNFQSLKRDNESTRRTLEDTKNVLDKTEIVLAHTKRNLAEETKLRQAHQKTEEKLAEVGEDLLSTLSTTTDHVDRLHSKLRRRSDLQSLNRGKWTEAREHVSSVTGTVEERIEELRGEQEGLIASLSDRMQTYVKDELQQLQSSQTFLREKADAFEASEKEVNAQTSKSKDEMNGVLEEIRTLREDVKSKVGAGLSDLSAAAQNISAGIATELDAFHGQLQASYVSLGREFKTTFEDLIKRMNEQQAEAQKLREQIMLSNTVFVEAGHTSQTELQKAVEEERQTAAAERAALIAKVAALINDSAATQEARLQGHIEQSNKRIKTSEDEYRSAQQTYGSGMDVWSASAQSLIDTSIKSRESIKSKLKADWGTANESTTKLTETTNAVHSETTRIVDGQMAQMDGQLIALDEIISRVRAQNEEHHKTHTSSLSRLASNVQESYQSIGAHFQTSYSRTKALETSMDERTTALYQTLPTLAEEGEIRQPLHQLRHDMDVARIAEYDPTGDTPAKTQYPYPAVLPRTQDHDTLLDRMRGGGGNQSPKKDRPRSPNKRASPSKTKSSPSKPKSSPTKGVSSPSKTAVYTDCNHDHGHTINFPLPTSATARPQSVASDKPSLRELDVNVTVTGAGFPSIPNSKASSFERVPTKQSWEELSKPPHHPAKLNRHHTSANPLSVSQGPDSKLPALRKFAPGRMTMAEGRENQAPPAAANLSASVGAGGGRVLRSRGSQE